MLLAVMAAIATILLAMVAFDVLRFGPREGRFGVGIDRDRLIEVGANLRDKMRRD